MANYETCARSNYFAVKDESKFIEWADSRMLNYNKADSMFMIYPDESWPSVVYNTDTLEDDDVDIAEELSKHLADDDVAILIEIGHEKHRCVEAYAMAINSLGEIETLDLAAEIYKKAIAMGENVTPSY